MLLREFLSGVDLWGEIKNVESFSFISDATTLNLMQRITYGEREFFGGFDGVEVAEISVLIVNTFGEKWNSLIDSEIKNQDISSSGTKIITNTIKTEGVKTGNNINLSKVSGYNTDELITENGNDTTSNEDTTKDVLSDSKESNLSYDNLYKNLSIAEQSNIINVALLDVARYLTYSIY